MRVQKRILSIVKKKTNEHIIRGGLEQRFSTAALIYSSCSSCYLFENYLFLIPIVIGELVIKNLLPMQ